MFKRIKEMDKKEVVKKALYVTGIVIAGTTIAYIANRNYDPTVDLENYKKQLEDDLEILNDVLND